MNDPEILTADAAPAPAGAEAPLSVLVLDDEEGIRDLFETALSAAGNRVETAENARQALRILMQRSFDVLVVDLRMDGMDGIVFLQEALKVWPWLGVVIVSGYADAESTGKAEAMGVSRILEKPVRLPELVAEVQDEGSAKRASYKDIPRGNALALMRDHLRLLDGLDSKHVSSETLVGTLLEFGKALADLLNSSAVGILVHIEHELERDLLVYAQQPVNQRFVAQVEAEMLDRYQALSGEPLEREGLHVQTLGAPCEETAPSQFGSALSVPILLGERFCGIITLAAAGEAVYSHADISLLYHAANQISAVFMALRQMHHLATRDHLTGVFNRIRLEEELERTWLLTKRYGSAMSVVVIDVDNFKTLNDSFGHAIGDEILRDLSRLIQQAARATDIVARYGGDEFVAILPQARDEDARAFGDRFMHEVRSHVFCPDSHRLRLTASAGLASTASSSPPATSDELLQQADRALYMAKRAGRNRACLWPEGAVSTTAGTEEPQPAAPHEKDFVLLVDDEPAVLQIIATMLESKGHHVTTCASAEEALQQIGATPEGYDVLITDLSMPGKSGIDLLQEVGKLDGTMVKIVMTGHATVNAAVDALREGAYDFIEKPVHMAELTALVGRALEYRQLRLENARYQAHLEDMVRQRSAELTASLEEVKQSYRFTLEALVAMLDARERQTGQHSVRTRDLAVALAQRMGITGSEVEAIGTGAFLHDIGKIGIPDTILLKPDPLLPEEWRIMETHSEIGYNILRSSPNLNPAAEIVYAHHERFDGKGYPRGLAGADICIGARIFSVVDAYDSMRSNRIYHAPMAPGDALDEILGHSGTQFDPDVVKAFAEHHEDLEQILSQTE